MTFGLLWRVVQSARPGRVIAAGIVAVLSVQALYQNAFLLFAMGVAGMIVAARAGRWRSVAAVAGIGLAAAVSLLPYAFGPVRAAGAWSVVSQGGLPWDRLWTMFDAALRSSSELMPWAWLLAAVVLGAVALFAQKMPGGEDLPAAGTPSREARWYAAGAMLLALPVFVGFPQVSRDGDDAVVLRAAAGPGGHVARRAWRRAGDRADAGAWRDWPSWRSRSP